MSCHAVRGVNEIPETLGAPGPDLTHFGSRRTIAAATVPNEPEGLARWIFAPDEIKRGSRMPASRLEPERLSALVAYLESLK
ncbi:MAG: c-type cytochrome [Gammaproteobacteria bacterium]|nr:cytochrome c [Gemmatimonadota bacterium]NIU76443.1 c-type cytochrome [Gammaproteobacteria bacterium]NIY10232.1 c-type cytochrome [Gemmatimonadota bacterium]